MQHVPMVSSLSVIRKHSFLIIRSVRSPGCASAGGKSEQRQRGCDFSSHVGIAVLVPRTVDSRCDETVFTGAVGRP